MFSEKVRQNQIRRAKSIRELAAIEVGDGHNAFVKAFIYRVSVSVTVRYTFRHAGARAAV